MIKATELTVSELNARISAAVGNDPYLKSVTVRGEISGFKHHIASGHWYMTLKDDNASVSCVMYRQNTLKQTFRPKDGDRVTVSGYVDIYQKSGQLQLYLLSVRLSGVGELYLRFEELKNRLYREGLFDPSKKKMLPMMPKKVAVITSESGAALHDILNVSGNRNPSVPIVLIPVKVQGEEAAFEIAKAIELANRIQDIDVIILARGGGSAEDLWCFNEECIARAIFRSEIPVVTGIGHEIDFTISDYTADVRASTPSNAAEIVFPDVNELKGRNNILKIGLKKSLSGRISDETIKLRNMSLRLKEISPEKYLSDLQGKTGTLLNAIQQAIDRCIGEKTIRFSNTDRDLRNAMEKRIEHSEEITRHYRSELKAISPLSVLDRGFALVYSSEGHLLPDAKTASENDVLTIQFRDGKINTSRKG